ncbi:Ubiquinone biosynthesis O-methyltransferase [Nocardia cerradoensis]|uniref:Ubiquinone biosynthesis O-methyltransferase n=1 Tax=Nocardia cerradoensis TaxID=85688 RepID=A0A231HC03_9NOCA|nr:class I SAM-dependent methyltransferase [Nocardia cerradoensis]OXR46349.1 Ubiquinone biosynthesis O-methyltransferase [Nocardia cerradoensis]
MNSHPGEGVDIHGTGTTGAHSHREHGSGGREFDRQYWEQRYHGAGSASASEPNPHLTGELADLPPGTALDAGCGEGAEAIWLAEHGWHVTAVDIATAAVARGREKADRAGHPIADRIVWHTADLTEWDAGVDRFDLVCACYVHPVDSNDALFERLAAAVAPGGTLFLVGHAPGDHESAAHTSAAHVHVTAEQIAAGLAPDRWDIQVVESRTRSVVRASGEPITLRDSVFRARKR